jgi:hypothetical protein
MNSAGKVLFAWIPPTLPAATIRTSGFVERRKCSESALPEQIEPFATDRNEIAPHLRASPNNNRSTKPRCRHEHTPGRACRGASEKRRPPPA